MRTEGIVNPSIAVLYTQSPEAETLRGRDHEQTAETLRRTGNAAH
jgi:hypothetical protein